MKRMLVSVFQLLSALVVLCLAMATTMWGQTPTEPQPFPSSRRALPKPGAESRGFEKYAKRDSSSRLIAAAATRRMAPRRVPKPLDPATTHYQRGQSFYAALKYKEAVGEFAEAVRLRLDWVQAHYALALSLTETENLTEAIEEFKRVLKLQADEELTILSCYNMGNAYADLGQFKEAIEAYQLAIKLNPTLSKAHNNLALAYVASDQMQEAVAEFNQAVHLQSDYAAAHFNLGVAYLQLKRKREARQQQELLVKLNSLLAGELDALIKSAP